MTARLTWIEGQLEYQRSREGARPYRKHYVVNDGKLLIVEFWPPVETEAGENKAPSTTVTMSGQSVIAAVPSKRTHSPTSLDPDTPASPCQLPLSHDSLPTPVASPSLDVSRSSSSGPSISNSKLAVKQEPPSDEMPLDLSPHANEPSQHKEHRAGQDSLSPALSSHLFLPHLNVKPMPMPLPLSPTSEEPDVANIMRLVRATNHHQVILPSRERFNLESSSSFKPPMPRILVTDRYVISWMIGNYPDFVSRLPPR